MFFYSISFLMISLVQLFTPCTFVVFYLHKFREHDFVGAAQCLGELYKHFGRRITSGLLETTVIAAKLLKFNEVFLFSLHLCKLNYKSKPQ